MPARLSVNVNKVALLRNARGGDVPNLVRVALDCVRFGAQGITVHPRPDERHIRRADVHALAEALRREAPGTEFNVEGYPSEDFLALLEAVRPHQATLVPDPPGALTSSAGWDARLPENARLLTAAVARLKAAGIRVSIFIETESDLFKAAADTGTERVELYTGPYAEDFVRNRYEAVLPFVRAAEAAAACGLGLNAGHDLNTANLPLLAARLPGLLEVSIGHALIADALYWGLAETIRRYRACLLTPEVSS